MSKLWLALVFISLKTSYSVWACVVPPPSLECSSEGCNMYNYRGVWDERFNCTASAAYFPTSEAQVVDIVAMAVEKNRAVKVISHLAHSLTPLVCVGDGGVIVSTRDLFSYSYVDTDSQTITVDAGLTMRDVFDEAAKHGLTLYDAPWSGVTAAGSISTGSHGSSLRDKGSGVYEYVTSLRLVVPSDSSEGYAKVIELTESDEEFKAAVLSLGTLGVITRVTFKLEPMFKRRVSYSTVSDDNLEDIFQDFMMNIDFPYILWNIGVGNASLQTSLKVSTNIPGNSNISTLGSSVNSTEQSARDYERLLMTGQVEKLCTTSSSDSNVTVGYNDKMATGGGCEDYHLLLDPDPACLPHQITDKNEDVCSWDRRVLGLLVFDEAIKVPISRARDAILDLKKLRELSPHGALCQFSNGGLGMRAIKKSQVYLGPPEDMVTFEFFQYHDRRPFTPTTYMDVVQEMEQILIQKHGGQVHWGKSGGYLFEGQAQHKVVDFNGFMSVKRKYDPKGVFSNPWTEGLLGIGGKSVEVVKKGCAIEKMCKCSEDEHCSPQDGYLCKPGRVWPQARVCRKV